MSCLTNIFHYSLESSQKFGAHVWSEHRGALILMAAGVVTLVVYNKMAASARRRRWNSAGKDVVVLHAINRSPVVPNLSPFVVKLETYLRMAGIQYKFDTEVPIGPKGKCPWITLNGQDMADSELIIKFLAKKFNKNFSSQLTSEQKGVAKALQVMCDEHLLWGYIWQRFVVFSPSEFLNLIKVPLYLELLIRVGAIRRQMSKRLTIQGLGRHTNGEITDLLIQNIEALSNYLGTKLFMMGEKPCEVDCCVFGHLAQFVWGLPGSELETIVHRDYKNLVAYVDRMKKEFYPDWNELCKF